MTAARSIPIESDKPRRVLFAEALDVVLRYVLWGSAGLLLASLVFGGARGQVGALGGAGLSLLNAHVIAWLGRWASRGEAETAKQRLAILLGIFQLKLGFVALSIYLMVRYLPVAPPWLLAGLLLLPLAICALAGKSLAQRQKEIPSTMGEESTWFDLFPGLPALIEYTRPYLGREHPGQRFYFRGGPLGESHFTLTHVLATLLVLGFVTLGALSFAGAMRRGGEEAVVPPARFSLRNLFELLSDAVWNLTRNVMGEKNARRYLPLVGTLACFIFFSNALALIPGMVPPTTTLKTNVALALTVFVITHVEGIRAQGAVNYLKHFLGPFWWLVWIMLPIELISHLARPLSLSLRLMGNMVSDHKVVSVFFGLVPLLLPVPFLILGTLVVIVQTLVFCLLTMVYINMAVSIHEHAHEEHPSEDHVKAAHAH